VQQLRGGSLTLWVSEISIHLGSEKNALNLENMHYRCSVALRELPFAIAIRH